MRLFGFFFLFCISIGTVSSISLGNIQWPPWLTSFFNNTINQILNPICSYLAAHPECALNAINSITTTLGKINQTANTFVQTINYLNSTQNQQNLIGGTSTCETFFNGLKTALQTDLTNQNITLSKAQDTASQIFNNILNDLNKNFN